MFIDLNCFLRWAMWPMGLLFLFFMAFIQNMLRSLKIRSLIKIIVDETINNDSPLMHEVSRHIEVGGCALYWQTDSSCFILKTGRYSIAHNHLSLAYTPSTTWWWKCKHFAQFGMEAKNVYYFFCLYLEFSLEEILSLCNSLWKKDKTLILLKKKI